MKEPTCVFLVEEVLRLADDFVTAGIIIEKTGLKFNQVSASLYHLKKYKTADFVENNGLWWFYTPKNDTRFRHVELRTKEEKPRRTRRSKMVAQK